MFIINDMDLKTLCLDNLVNVIKQLPPILRDEIIGETTKSIKKEAEKNARIQIMKEIHRSVSIAVEDITERIINSYGSGHDWKRPEYTYNIDKDIYGMIVDISEKFVQNNAEKLIFNGLRTHHRQSDGMIWSEESDEESD